MRSRPTLLPRVPGFTAIARPTSTMGRPSSSTIPTGSRRNSGGNFEDRPLAALLFLLDMDYLLYEMSIQRGDAQLNNAERAQATTQEVTPVTFMYTQPVTRQRRRSQ